MISLFEDADYLAIVIAAVVNMAIGAFWYSPAGFGKQWAALMGWSDAAKMDAMKKKAGKSYAWMFVASLVMACVLAQVVRLAGASTIMEGAIVGFWIWLGFVVTVQIGSILWDQKPAKLFAINTGYSIVSLAIMGALLALWA